MACAPSINQKSFWIPSNPPPNTCRAGWAIFFLQKHIFVKHPNVHCTSSLFACFFSLCQVEWIILILTSRLFASLPLSVMDQLLLQRSKSQWREGRDLQDFDSGHNTCGQTEGDRRPHLIFARTRRDISGSFSPLFLSIQLLWYQWQAIFVQNLWFSHLSFVTDRVLHFLIQRGLTISLQGTF